MRNFNVIFRKQVSGFIRIIKGIFYVTAIFVLLELTILLLPVIGFPSANYYDSYPECNSEANGSATGIIPPNPSTPRE